MVVPWAWSGHRLILLHAVRAQVQPLNSFVRASAKDFWLSGEDRLLVGCWQRVWGKSDFIPALLLPSCSTCSAAHYWGLYLGFIFIFFKRDSGLDHFNKRFQFWVCLLMNYAILTFLSPTQGDGFFSHLSGLKSHTPQSHWELSQVSQGFWLSCGIRN